MDWYSHVQRALEDAFDVVVGAVLQHCHDGQWGPIAFFSECLKPAETGYSTFKFDRELLAVYISIKIFL